MAWAGGELSPNVCTKIPMYVRCRAFNTSSQADKICSTAFRLDTQNKKSTDGLAVEVEQRPAAVAERDGGVRLDVLAHVAALESELSLVPGRTGQKYFVVFKFANSNKLVEVPGHKLLHRKCPR